MISEKLDKGNNKPLVESLCLVYAIRVVTMLFKILTFLIPSDWGQFLLRMRKNFSFLKSAPEITGHSTGRVALFSRAIKVASKETIDVTGNLDYSGSRILMDVSSFQQMKRLSASTKEPETIAWIESEIKHGDVFYDIGANVGAYSFVAWAHTDRKCKGYAFEPSFSTFAALCKNIFLNSASKSIIPFQVALGPETKLASLNYSDITPGSALHKFNQNSSYPNFSQEILGYKLDDFIKTFGLPYPNHIKIDVDDYELDVLLGCEATFSHPHLNSVLIEISKSSPQSQGVYKFFERKKFSLVSKKERGAVFNCIFKRL